MATTDPDTGKVTESYIAELQTRLQRAVAFFGADRGADRDLAPAQTPYDPTTEKWFCYPKTSATSSFVEIVEGGGRLDYAVVVEIELTVLLLQRKPFVGLRKGEP